MQGQHRWWQLGRWTIASIGAMGSIGATIGLVAPTPQLSLADPTPGPRSASPIRTARFGNTQAELLHSPSPEPGRDSYRLSITRQGKRLLDRVIDTNQIPGLYRLMGMEVRDLDGDREPEILLDHFSGGAHCCSSAHIYRYESGQYRLSSHDFGNGGYALRDSDRDGKPEFWSRDDAFAYRFTAYAGSRYPLQVWGYNNGNWQDITRRYGAVLKDHAFGLWRDYQEMRPQLSPTPAQIELSQIRATLAAYLADKYLLNQGEDGWRRVRQAYRWSDRDAFFTDLQRFFGANAYLAGPFNDRITFEPNADSSSIGGRLLPGLRHRYKINVRAGQSFMLSPSQPSPMIRVIFPDGKLWYSVASGQSIGMRQLPQSGDYVIELVSDRDRRYGIGIEVR